MRTYTTTPEYILDHFVYDQGLFKRRADGTLRPVTSMEGGQLCCTLHGERLKAVDIVWCLYYGNWPRFRLTQLDGNPHNLDLTNIMPVRVRQLRCTFTHGPKGVRHSLSDSWFRDEKQARQAWASHAREHYAADLRFVIDLETNERNRRAATLASQPKLLPEPPKYKPRGLPFGDGQQPGGQQPGGKPKKPEKIEGRVWRWVKTEWVSLPESCHVADDWHVRLRKQRAGAVRFAYQPEWGEVWGFDAAGDVVR